MFYTILNEKKHWRYFALLLLGGISMVWQIDIYRQTIISISIPLIFIFLSGLIAYLIDKKNYSSTYEIKYINVWCWMQNTVSWGFLICTFFMVINKYLANDIVTTSTHNIISTGTMVGNPRDAANEKPLLRIDYYGKTKELVFTKKYLAMMNSAKTVTIETKNGFFGYKVVNKQTVNY